MLEGKAFLDTMTSQIVSHKQEKAQSAGLTPVGLEKGAANGREKRAPLDGRHDVIFPFDDQQTIHQAIIDGLKAVTTLTYHVEHIRDGLKVLAECYGVLLELPPATPTPEIGPKIDRAKEAAASAWVEKKAEEKFQADFAEQSKKAQAEVFAPAPVPPVPVEPETAEGWSCPKHEYKTLTTLTSKRGRVYRACLSCSEFER